MNSYIICIPSYKRAKICNDQTLTLLKSIGVSKDLVKVFIVEEEKEEYERTLNPELYGELVIGALGLVPQRQFITDYFPEGQHIVSLDDDITGLDLSMTDFKSADEFFINAFETCSKEKAFLWSVYPVFNPFFRKSRQEITTSISVAIGAFYGYINRPLDDFLKRPLCLSGNKEDVERSIRYYLKDGKIVRFNRVGFNTKYYGKDGGGLGIFQERIEDMKTESIALNTAFPDITRIKIRKNGLYEIVLREKPPKHSRTKITPEPLDIEIIQPEYLEEFNDTSKLFEMLSSITVPVVSSNNRKSFDRHRAMTLGIIKGRVTKIYSLSRSSKKFPQIYEEVVRIGKLICPFEFESIHLNHNVVCPRHIDRGNTGESVIISFGDYSGGTLFIESGEVAEYDTKNRPLKFNGSKYYHWNAPILEGNKYSLVFFNSNNR